VATRAELEATATGRSRKSKKAASRLSRNRSRAGSQAANVYEDRSTDLSDASARIRGGSADTMALNQHRGLVTGAKLAGSGGNQHGERKAERAD